MKLSTLIAGVLALCGVVTVRLQAQQPIDSFPKVISRPEVEVQALTINSTTEDDFAPVVLRGGDLLIFTSARSGPFGPSGTQRIWTSSRQPAGWTTPASTSEALTHAEQSGAAALTPDGNFMIFAAYEWSDKTMAVSGRTDLYSAERVRGEWTNIQNLGPIVNSPDWDSQPALSVDGRTLYFASDRPGGSGGADIYVTRRTASGWSAPVNVGTAVNTVDDDLSPSIAPDGKSLFFASKGHGGVGGFDLFVAKGGNDLGTGWGNIENLGTPINSAANDYFFSSIPNSKNSMFSSDRSGNLDIYTAYPNPYPPEALVTVSGHVLEHGSNQPIAASITVTDLSSGEVVANYTTDDRTGDYFVVLARGHRYSITAESPDHIFYSDEYAIPPNTPAQDMKKDILLYRTSGGNTRLLVFFDFDQADLKTESKPDLNRAIAFLRQNPTINVEIAGYTDSVGTAEYNTKLSQDRANSVRTYLIGGGIDQSRMKAVGYGEDQPVADNATEEGRARNRRVEMRVR